MPPSTTYDTATVLNPTSALTDFTLMVDLSRMSSAWWSAAESIDATNGRAAKDDGTELACDWIDYTHGSPVGSGWLRVKWSGTLATSGTQVLRIYPPVTGNGTVAAGDALGSNNAYASDCTVHAPLNGNLTDRSGNGRDGVVSGSPGTIDPATNEIAEGPFGSAIDFNGEGTVEFPREAIANLQVEYTAAFWYNPDPVSGFRAVFCTEGDANNGHLYGRQDTTNRLLVRGPNGINSLHAQATGWQLVAFSSDGVTDTTYLNGSLETGVSGGGPGNANVQTFMLGGNNSGQSSQMYYAGVQTYNGDRSAAWHEQEYDQTDSQASFFGTWANVPLPSEGGESVACGRDICRHREVSRIR